MNSDSQNVKGKRRLQGNYARSSLWLDANVSGFGGI